MNQKHMNTGRNGTNVGDGDVCRTRPVMKSLMSDITVLHQCGSVDRHLRDQLEGDVTVTRARQPVFKHRFTFREI